MTDPATETRSVIIERDFACPPERLWRALTQPHLLEEWLMKTDFQPVVGHCFDFAPIGARSAARSWRSSRSGR